jgi:hypothetical protein
VNGKAMVAMMTTTTASGNDDKDDDNRIFNTIISKSCTVMILSSCQAMDAMVFADSPLLFFLYCT